MVWYVCGNRILYGVEFRFIQEKKENKKKALASLFFFFFAKSHHSICNLLFVICYLYLYFSVFCVLVCVRRVGLFFLLDDPDPCTQINAIPPTSTPSPPSLSRKGGFFFVIFFAFHFVKKNKNQSGMERFITIFILY